MLERLLETLYNKVFVNILLEGSRTQVYIEVCSGNTPFEVLENAHKSFDTNVLSAELVAYIQSFTKETPYFYIAILDTSLEQGAIPTCDKKRLAYYHDVSACEYKCSADNWTFFTSKSDLYALEKKYHKVGLDFVFSPFTLLAHFFKDKQHANFVMFVLVETAAISLMIFENTRLVFADYLDMHHIPEEDALSSGELDDDFDLDLEDSIDLEGIDVDAQEMEMIDDFGDIEDLDSLEEIDEFSEHKDIEEELLEAVQEPEGSSGVATKDSFNEDYRRFALIQSAVGHYYKDERYASSFIENVYVADGVGMSSEFKRYLEEEMFVNVYIRQADIAMEMCELAKMEFEA
ncbi:MAG: hypothetical protein JXQ67_04095 [Campylobacterales bacterium]|nr:hypothetical protein [Campylobacterales bacterium]